jgi:hypothetical protein
MQQVIILTCLIALPALSLAVTITPAASSEKILSAWYQSNGSTNWNMTSQIVHLYYENSYVYVNANSMPGYGIGSFLYLIKRGVNPSKQIFKEIILGESSVVFLLLLK